MLRLVVPKRPVLYQVDGKTCPYRRWLVSINDERDKIRILARIDRALSGNLGDHRSVGSGVIELRIQTGPGYRIYIGIYGEELVLLCGGDKSSQKKDIVRAKEFWANYRGQE